MALDNPRRIVFILPCCIGDVVMATAALKALRRGYPDAHITWAIGSWSKVAIEHHALIDAKLETGEAALPLRSPAGFRRFVRQLRAGNFDLAVSLVRSPLMSLAVLLSGIPHRAGLDSAGRGFGYNIRAPINPAQARHEAEIYLDVPRALGLDTSECWANVQVDSESIRVMREDLVRENIYRPYIVMHPGGGQNPGMMMDIKRWPPEHFAQLAKRLSKHYGASVVVIGGPRDKTLVDSVSSRLQPEIRTTSFAGSTSLSFRDIGALAHEAFVYVGNDTGATHYAAAAGARTVMILGPSDPARYAPFTPDSLALWKPASLPGGGVAAGAHQHWDWARDGISVDEAEAKITQYLNANGA